MASTEQKSRLLKAKITVALQDELGRVPKEKEIEQVYTLCRVMWDIYWDENHNPAYRLFLS